MRFSWHKHGEHSRFQDDGLLVFNGAAKLIIIFMVELFTLTRSACHAKQNPFLTV